MENQGLTGVQMLVLSLALQLGRVVAPGTFLGEYVLGGEGQTVNAPVQMAQW